MKYEFRQNNISGVFEIVVDTFEDERGFAIKNFSLYDFDAAGIKFEPSEILTIESKKNVLRGLHIQSYNPQKRLLSCIRGRIFVAIVDLRPGSISMGKKNETIINSNQSIYIPEGCALGTFAIEDSIMVCCFDGKHSDEFSSGIVWEDPNVAINWPVNANEIVISEKDKHLPSLKEYCSLYIRHRATE